MRCMWCPFACEDRSLLAQHIRSVHADKTRAVMMSRAVEHGDAHPRLVVELPVAECDIDRIYLARPDLVARRCTVHPQSAVTSNS